MRGGFKTLVTAAAVLLLVMGLAACGGSDSSSTATQAEAQGTTESNGGASSEDQPSAGGGEESAGGSSGSFVPKQHNDSGGGSEQLKVKGGDNSVQEFGAEADTSEFEEAAAALHDFLDARAAGDWSAACGYLTATVTESLEKLAAQAKHLKDVSCAGVFEKLTNPAALGELRTEAAQADVASLRIKGDQAFLIYRGAGDTVLAMPMADEDGSWKVASLSSTPLN